MLSIVSAASAFSGPMPMARPAVQPMMVEKSAAIPFLKKPPALDGSMPGDVGFDPLGFSTTITELGGDLNYVREAELMHGRQAMLAVVGFVAPALFGKLPVGWTADVSTNPLEAQYQLPPEVFYQVVISIFIAEGLRAQVHTQTARSPLFRRTQRAQPHTSLSFSFDCSPIVPPLPISRSSSARTTSLASTASTPSTSAPKTLRCSSSARRRSSSTVGLR